MAFDLTFNKEKKPSKKEVSSFGDTSAAAQQTLSHADTPLYACIDGGGPRSVNYFGVSYY